MTVNIILEDFGCEGFDAPAAVFDSEQKARDYISENFKDLYNPTLFKMEVK